MKKSVITIFLIFICIISSSISIASVFPDPEESFALEYKSLRVLLEKVKTPKTAKEYKDAIEKQISHLRKNQTSGAEHFNSLSAKEKKFFIKKFQNNHLHCGEVTQVMHERRRILLAPDLAIILRDTLAKIP